MKTNDLKKRKSGFNPDRTCYLTADGKFYVYVVWDEEGRRDITHKFEVGKDLSLDITLVLDESDHDMDLNDRYQDELRDPLFDAQAKKYDIANGDIDNPWGKIADKDGDPEGILFAEPKLENPQAAAVRRVIEEDCTEAQQAFYYDHFGMNQQLETMRQAEAEQTGKLPSPAAMTNRKNKIIKKVAKALGTERVKRHKPTKKD